MSSSFENGFGDKDDTLDDFSGTRKEGDLTEGTRVQRYIVLGLIGKGGMGAVYMAYDPELDRKIALKILTLTPLEGETASLPQARLMREAQALARLNHPNVVSVYDVGTYADGIYIAMEYVQGETLRDWLKEHKPTQPQILEVFLAAGRGLQAAHAEGIVHRDYKPDNVIVGDNGQVKVLDFGLARAADFEVLPSVKTHAPTKTSSQSGDHLLSQPLTQVGAMIGTIAYMAPEHFLFQDLDEKTDQFSFCVTLFEALYGCRPFTGRSKDELEEKVTNGRIDIPKDISVPSWVEDIVLRGLSVCKQDRFENISALLEALGNNPELARKQKRRKQYFVLALILAAVTFFSIGSMFFQNSEICTGAQHKVAGVWNTELKADVEQSFIKTGLVYALDSFVRVTNRLDEYLTQWTREYTETCEATRVRGERSEEVLDLKMECLDRRLMTARALIKLLCSADRRVVAKSVEAVSSLTALSRCHDVNALRTKIQPPSNEQTAIKVRALRQKLSEVVALDRIGKYKQGLQSVKKLWEETNRLAYQPLRAQVLYWYGQSLAKTGEYKAAEKTLAQAAQLAGESQDYQLAAKAMISLVWNVGYRQARHEDGLLIARDAEVVVGLSGGDDTIRSLLLNKMGAVFYSKGENDKALQYYSQALDIQRKELGPSHPALAHPLNNLGVVYDNMGEFDKALASYRKALAIHVKTLGSEHPLVANNLNNIGGVYRRKEENQKAIEYYARALAIKEKTLGPQHPDLATSLYNLGETYTCVREYNKAMNNLQRSLRIMEKALGKEHPLITWPLSGLGEVLLKTGKRKQAREHFVRVTEICQKKDCDIDPMGQAYFGLARLFLADGDKQGVRLAQKAKKLFSKMPSLKKKMDQIDQWIKKNT